MSWAQLAHHIAIAIGRIFVVAAVVYLAVLFSVF
jgi:hypothetical protein